MMMVILPSSLSTSFCNFVTDLSASVARNSAFTDNTQQIAVINFDYILSYVNVQIFSYTVSQRQSINIKHDKSIVCGYNG